MPNTTPSNNKPSANAQGNILCSCGEHHQNRAITPADWRYKCNVQSLCTNCSRLPFVISCNHASIAVSWFRTMEDSLPEAFARQVLDFPGVSSLPLGWRSNWRSSEDMRDYWYLGDSREDVDRVMASARFFRDNGTVEMPVICKQIFSIDCSTKMMGWARVYGASQCESLQHAMEQAWRTDYRW